MFRSLIIGLLAAVTIPAAGADLSLFTRTNLVAWCIVPFDAKKRGPEERAQMLERLGVRRMAYDWRDEHIPTFDEEVLAMKRHGIEITAWWTPGALNDTTRKILDVLARHQLKSQLWVLIGEPLPGNPDQKAKAKAAAEQLRPLAEEAAKIGCPVALYNHGGWFGEPENQIAIIEELNLPNVGIVYNFHHGHDHIDRFPELLAKMKPHLLALNLNGMILEGDKTGHKILHLSEGDREMEMMRVVLDSGWRGPIGILDHRPETDSEVTLRNNLTGLDWLLKELAEPGSGGPRPFQVPDRPSKRSATDFWAPEDAAARAQLPEYKIIPAAKPAELTPALPGSIAARGAGRDWPRSHGDSAGTRFSRLTEINRDNVHALRPAWTYRSKDGVGNIQCNPVIVDGVIYAPTVGDHVVAINGRNGRELWRFKPEGRPAHRGLLYWPGNDTLPPALFFPAGKWLYALDPATGKPHAGFGDYGRVETGVSVVAPVIHKNVIILPGFDKDVFGYDLCTGKRIWTFHTVPRPGEFGHETWDRPGAGANCWGGLVLDEDRGIVYVSTGSPKPNFVGVHHRGDNLFANCVIALDAATGKRLWHFQEIRHDIWDLDIPAPPNLITVERGGVKVDAVAQVTKLGNTLLLDRVTGSPLFPFRLRRAPASNLPGERTSPYQPDPELPRPFAKQTFSLDHVTDRTPEAREFILNLVRNANYGWFEPFAEGKPTVLWGIHGGAEWTGAAVDPDSGRLYVSANEIPWIVTVFRTDDVPRDPNQPPTQGEKIYQAACASCHGVNREGVGVAPPLQGLRHRMTDAEVIDLLMTGRNVMPAAPPMSDEDRQALLDHLFLRDRPQTAAAKNGNAPPQFTHNGYPKLLDHEGYPGCKPPWGTLNCLDLNTGEIVWQVPLGEYPELTAAGIPKTGTENFGGPSVTAGGLVFCAGTRDEKIRAFDAETGAELWSHKLPFGGYAPPAIYKADGRQYVVIAATGGGKLGGPMGDAYVAFSLPD